MKILVQRLIAIFIGVLLFLIAGEVVYRTYVHARRPLFRPSSMPGFLWEPTPSADVVEDGVRYTINSNGFRDYEYPVEKKKGVFRIAVIGDSVAWGEGVDLADSYPKVIEKRLRERHGSIDTEVLNFGVRGVGPKQYLSILKERVLKYNPDLIVFGYTLNDIRSSSIYERPILMWLLQHSYFADFIAVRAGQLLWTLNYTTHGESSRKFYFDDHLRMYEDKEKLWKLKNVLKEIRGVLREEGIGSLLIICPFEAQLAQNGPHTLQDVLATICKEVGIPFFDPLSDFQKYNKNRLFLEGGTVHFSQYGNRAMGEIIAEHVMKSKAGILEVREFEK